MRIGLPMLSLFALAVTSSCKKDNANAAEKLQAAGSSPRALTTMTSNADLIAYKNSAHKIFVGFLVGDGADAAASFNPANAPDSTDFLSFLQGMMPPDRTGALPRPREPGLWYAIFCRMPILMALPKIRLRQLQPKPLPRQPVLMTIGRRRCITNIS